MKHISKVFTLAAIIASGLAIEAQAASLTYTLNDINGSTSLDGPDYVTVTLEDVASVTLGTRTYLDAVKFTVSAGSMFTAEEEEEEEENFGFQTFGFNVASGISLNSNKVKGLPNNWSFSSNQNISEFGRFSVKEAGRGNSRRSPLSFYIVDVNGDDVTSYAQANTRGNLFVAHLAGFSLAGFTGSSAYFSGGVPLVAGDPTNPVPVPAAAWFFGPALFGLMGFKRKSSSAAMVTA